jgi:N-acetylglucosamine-6-phosphate deacetylase
MMQVFYGARLFDGERMLDDAALVIDGGRIATIVPVAERPMPGSDLGGGVLSPGLVDVQVNGGGGALFNETPTPEGMRAIAQAHRRDGTTGLLPTVVTDTPQVLASALDAARAAVAERVPGVLGIHVEGPFIDPRRPGAHSPQLIRPMMPADADRLIAARTATMLVTVAPVSVSDSLIRRLRAGGVILSLGHSEATDSEALRSFDAGITAVTHLYNAMSPLTHRAPGVVGATLARPDIICGLIADGHHVAPTAVRVALAAKGSDGIALISDAMSPALGGPDEFLLQGRPVFRRGGKLVLEDGTLAGSAISLMDAVRWLHRELGLDLAVALKMATLTPARLLRLDGEIGRLRPGSRADLVHIGEDLAVRETWIEGVASANDGPP